MKVKHSLILLLITITAVITSSILFADDGAMFRRNISKTPDQETERANINHMTFYVPAQSSSGELVTLEYFYVDNETDEPDFTREYAKPLVVVYVDGLPEEHQEEGFSSIMSGAGWGQHDAYAAVSLDDGASWKRTNLSNSAHLSSFTLANGYPYPGDAFNMTFAIAGDKVLVGWISKYCDGGSPMYTKADDHKAWLSEVFGVDPLYVNDLFGVAGSQKSVDYTLQGFPEVGEIPYTCIWSARGTLVEVELDSGDTGYDIVWTKAERLTSGRRDANRLEMAGDSAAGFMMVWQEDPEGLRPGQGLGPGEGWSGAVVNGQTDLWYSYISIANFEQVWSDDGDDAEPVSIYEYDNDSMPKVVVPMAMPIRLTDNAMCRVGGQNALPYCYINFEDVDDDGNLILPDLLPTAPLPEGASTFCADTVQWTTPSGNILTLCVAKDGRVMQGRVGASRPRVNVQPYETDGDGRYNNAWVIMGAEESKAMGEGGAPTDPGGGQPDEEEPEDVGKNMWYYSFSMLRPGFVMQGGMLNQPAKCNPYDADDSERCPGGVGEFYAPLTDLWGNQIYETEISRRFSHMSQPIHQIGDSGVSAVLIVKQGILNQGGPADIFLRMTAVPDDVWQACPTGSPYERCLPAGYNPYAYENLVCDEWAYRTDLGQEANPRYLQGLCLSNMINVSGSTIVACDNGTSGDDCAAAFPWDGGVSPFPKVIEWRQCGGAEMELGGFVCDDNDLDDQSWENPYDVAKGHRGFIDGDFIMMMYAWSPNWKANSVGNDHYNLYARRSFDGGLTWTTTPAELDGVGEIGDGSDPTVCENYGAGQNYTTVCSEYEPGAFEQSRNLSQLTGNKVTILDPRYTPTGGIKMLPITDLKVIGFDGYDDDVRDPSKYFIVYETGDNTTVAFGEATPLDLFYSRATNWGDDYNLVPYVNSSTGEVTYGFDWLENKKDDLSGEAANTCNNAGTFYYVIWNQWQEDEHENISNSDAIFRRIMYYPDDVERAPIASILYVSKTILSLAADDTLVIVGAAQSFGLNNEIEEVQWLFKPRDVNVAPVVIGTETRLQVQAQQIVNQPGWVGQPGWAQFQFMAKDKGNRWSPGVVVEVWVVDQLYQTYMPVIWGN